MADLLWRLSPVDVKRDDEESIGGSERGVHLSCLTKHSSRTRPQESQCWQVHP